MPVHNAEKWLDESINSVLAQNYDGPMEISFYNDASTDGSFVKMREWMLALWYAGIDAKITGKSDITIGRVERRSACKNRPDGIGFAKNRSVEHSRGSILVFFDADDIMAEDRVKVQVHHAIQNPSSIIGTTWKRFPDGSTKHYEEWANKLSNEEMILEQFRENTVQMPTWAMARKCFDDVPGFRRVASGFRRSRGYHIFFSNISIFTPKRINVAENSPSCEHLVVDVIKKNRYCITVGLKLPERQRSEANFRFEGFHF